jgi:outer membrane lipoprotein-sorting protein
VLEDVDRRAGTAADLVGRFRQEKHTALLKKPLVSSGRIRMKGPVVRWDTESPQPGVLYSDGREIRMYYPKQATLEVYPIDRRLSDLAASPLPRLDILRQHFRIEPAARDNTGETPRDTASGTEIRLSPSDAALAEHVDEVRVTLDVAAARVTRVEMLDADGDRTVIHFTDLKTDAGIKDGDLDLVVPAGTKVSRPLDAAQGGGTK